MWKQCPSVYILWNRSIFMNQVFLWDHVLTAQARHVYLPHRSSLGEVCSWCAPWISPIIVLFTSFCAWLFTCLYPTLKASTAHTGFPAVLFTFGHLPHPSLHSRNSRHSADVRQGAVMSQETTLFTSTRGTGVRWGSPEKILQKKMMLHLTIERWEEFAKWHGVKRVFRGGERLFNSSEE